MALPVIDCRVLKIDFLMVVLTAFAMFHARYTDNVKLIIATDEIFCNFSSASSFDTESNKKTNMINYKAPMAIPPSVLSGFKRLYNVIRSLNFISYELKRDCRNASAVMLSTSIFLFSPLYEIDKVFTLKSIGWVC